MTRDLNDGRSKGNKEPKSKGTGGQSDPSGHDSSRPKSDDLSRESFSSLREKRTADPDSSEGAKTPARRRREGGAETKSDLQFKVTDYDWALAVLTNELRKEVESQTREGYLGYNSMSKSGWGEDPIVDEFVALWKCFEKLEFPDPSSYSRKNTRAAARNIAAFLLLNEETRLNDATGPLLVKSGEPGNIRIADLAEAPLERVMMQVFRPELTEVGGQPIRLYRAMLTTPTADQIKTLQKKMRARLEAGKQLKEKQDKQGHEIRRRAEESEKQEAEKKERAELAKRKEFEKKSGLDSIKALHPKREKAALKRNFDKELEKLDARRKELEGLGNAARNLGLDHIQVINDARKETEQRISALSSCPAVPYQVIDPKAAINILRTMLDEEREAQISQVTLKYADHRRTLKASGNTGFYDERIALWQVVTKLLVKDTRTAEEESAMDLGLFNLSNDWLADFSDDFHSIKFEGNLSAHILTCMNSEKPEIVSETKAKYPKLDLTYPDAEHWSNIIWNMNQKLSDYKDTKTRQEEDIADAKWAESPQGRAEIARRQAENAAWHARQRQHDLEYEQYLGAQRAERENRERESW